MSLPSLTPALLDEAMKVGRTLPTDECVYGPPHWEGGFVDEPAPYYAFLAGLVRFTGVRTVMELGTHYGGSTLAFHIGLRPDDLEQARIVTVDVTRLNPGGLDKKEIRRLTGDSLDPAIVRAAMRAFESHVDLLYVDTVHTYRQTLENISVYANRLKPRYLVLDDINLNPGMRALWRDIQRLGPGEVFDVSSLVEREAPGFGVVDCRYPFTWPEASETGREALRLAWWLRREVSARTPDPWKVKLREARERLASYAR